MPHPYRSIILDEAPSTNTLAFERARAGEEGPLWIVARHQTQGRGRSGRQWTSVPGNLCASLLLQLACPLNCVHQLSLLAGVAVLEAIAAAALGAPIAGLRLKWPNDVLIGEAKCAGILPESQSSGLGEKVVVVIGIGLNLKSHPEGVGRAATSLAAHGLEVTPETMLGKLNESMARWLERWDGGAGFACVRAAWLSMGGVVGESITVNTGSELIAGAFVDLDASGALMLRDTRGFVRKLTYGDVSLVSPLTMPPARDGG